MEEVGNKFQTSIEGDMRWYTMFRENMKDE